MSLWIFLKIFSDCCVCFGILGAFPTVFDYGPSFLIPSVLCAAGAGISAFLSDRGGKWTCLIGLLFPAAVSYLLPPAQYPGVIPVSAYCCIVILRRQFALEYYSYRLYFKRSIFLMLGLYVMLSMLAFVESMSGSEISIIHPDVTLRCAVVHLIVGIILQRQLRLGSGNAMGGRYQIIGLLTTIALVIGVFLLAEPVLRKGAAALLSTALSLVLSVVMMLFNLIGGMEDAKHMYEQVNTHRGNSDTPVMGNVLSEIIQSSQTQAEEPVNWWIWLVIVLVIVVFALMLRTFRKKEAASPQVQIQESRISPRMRRNDSRRTSRGKIRHYYREYLRMEKKRGLVLKKDMTTADVLNHMTSRTNPEGAQALREIYLRARYRLSKAVTPEEAEKAKIALGKSREERSN